MEQKINFVRMSGVDHYVQRLYVHWDVSTLCQYKCTYCYARKQYGDEWGRLGDWNKQLVVIDELSKSSLPIFLGLLGGEPTLHQRYDELIELIKEKVLIHEDSRLYITTNGNKSTEWFAKRKDSNGKIYMLWSIHPEYVDEKEFEKICENIEVMHQKGFKTKVNLMLIPAKRYWDRIRIMYEKLNSMNYVILHPHFIYMGFDQDVNYKQEFYEHFKFLEQQREKEFVFYDEEREYNFSDYEIFSNGYNQFKGWNCWQNNYEIRYDCRISDQCFNRDPVEIPKDFFKNINKVESRKCPHNFCSCDGLMKIKKERA